MSWDGDALPENEYRAVARAMRTYGGSFVQALGEALGRADDINVATIQRAWPAYWATYLGLAMKKGWVE